MTAKHSLYHPSSRLCPLPSEKLPSAPDACPTATETTSTTELVELKVYVRKGGKLKYTLGEAGVEAAYEVHSGRSRGTHFHSSRRGALGDNAEELFP